VERVQRGRRFGDTWQGWVGALARLGDTCQGWGGALAPRCTQQQGQWMLLAAAWLQGARRVWGGDVQGAGFKVPFGLGVLPLPHTAYGVLGLACVGFAC
jgi:hypothetical protein